MRTVEDDVAMADVAMAVQLTWVGRRRWCVMDMKSLVEAFQHFW